MLFICRLWYTFSHIHCNHSEVIIEKTQKISCRSVYATGIYYPYQIKEWLV